MSGDFDALVQAGLAVDTFILGPACGGMRFGVNWIAADAPHISGPKFLDILMKLTFHTDMCYAIAEQAERETSHPCIST